MYIHPRSINHKVFDIWHSFDRFTKNPDIVQLPSGRSPVKLGWHRTNHQ